MRFPCRFHSRSAKLMLSLAGLPVLLGILKLFLANSNSAGLTIDNSKHVQGIKTTLKNYGITTISSQRFRGQKESRDIKNLREISENRRSYNIMATQRIFSTSIPMQSSKKQEKSLARTQKPHQFTTIQLNSGKTTAGYKLTTTKHVDMDNDYYPFVDFSLVWPETMPDLNGERDFFLVVVVNSAAPGEKYRLRRETIRRTWAKHKTKCERLLSIKNPKLKNHKWILVFALGTGDTADDKVNAEEAKIHNDVLIGNFEDNYINCIMKSFMGRLWVSSMNVRYVLKTDDDVFVRIPSVIDYLMAQGYPKPFYGGAPYFNFKVDRDPKGKWAISKKYFSEEYFPTFNAGGFYVLSTDILFKLFNYVRQRPPFHTEDTYIGIAARDMNITPQRIPGLLLEDSMSNMLRGMSDTRLIQARGYGHGVDPSTMTTVFNRLEKLCARNRTT